MIKTSDFLKYFIMYEISYNHVLMIWKFILIALLLFIGSEIIVGIIKYTNHTHTFTVKNHFMTYFMMLLLVVSVLIKKNIYLKISGLHAI